MDESHFNSSYFWSPIPTVQGQIESAMFLNKTKEQLGGEKPGAVAFPHSAASSAGSHYHTAVLALPGSAEAGPGLRAVTKQEGGASAGGAGSASMGSAGGHAHPTHTSQNVTVVPVPSTGIMTAAGLVITTPQGTLVPTPSTRSFAAGHHSAASMIVSALHPSNAEKKSQVSGGGHAAAAAVVVSTPGKRGRKSKQALNRATSVLPPGSDALILAHLAATAGQHHSADPYDLSNDEDEHSGKDGPKSYRCRMCAVTFFSKSDMQIHAKSHTEAKPHKCPHCSKSFANSSYLSQHIRIHSGAKPYSCTYCQKAFRQLSHLQQHTRIHTGDRPYKCSHPGCEKAFTQLSNLQSHRRQHNKDKPFKCHNCNRGYTDASSLEVHLSTHTVKHAKLFSCGLCNRSYTSETYLMKHMRKHNPDAMTAAERAQGPGSGGRGRGGRGRGRGRGRGASLQGRADPDGAGQQNPASAGPPGGYQRPGEGLLPCPFDLHQYKTVAGGQIQYKAGAAAADHKDLCLTVSTSAIQVEHMNS
ncbi:zinc finger protein 384a isoform X4 [Stigmatopora argus]